MRPVKCPYCSHEMNAINAFGEDRDPKEGDLMFCEMCSERSEFVSRKGKIVLKRLSDETRAHLEGSFEHQLMYDLALAMAERVRQREEPA